MKHRVLVTGGRRYADKARVNESLSALQRLFGIECIINGGATGADALAREWAKDRNVPVITVVPEWSVYGPAAGPIRNKRMLDEFYPTYVVAFNGDRGTANMKKLAKAVHLPIWQPDVKEEGP